MSIGLALFLTVLLLLGNAFFVGAEFAVISARRDRLEILADEGKTRARMAIRAGHELLSQDGKIGRHDARPDLAQGL